MAKMHEYVHEVQYYETDQMAVAHHSNYIRWLEETRVAVLERNGCGYAAMEAVGIVSPVVSVACKYLRPTRFGDRVRVRAHITQYTGVRLYIAYELWNEKTGELCAEATSEHCFLRQNKPISLKRAAPAFHVAMQKLCEE